MEQAVEVEIVNETISARYGTLTAGAILRTDQAYASHLVNDCAAARYMSRNVSTAVAPLPEQGTVDGDYVAAEAAAPTAEAPAVQTSAQVDQHFNSDPVNEVLAPTAEDAVQTSAQSDEKAVSTAEVIQLPADA